LYTDQILFGFKARCIYNPRLCIRKIESPVFFVRRLIKALCEVNSK